MNRVQIARTRSMHTTHVDPRLQYASSTCDRRHLGKYPFGRFAISSNTNDQRDGFLKRHVTAFGINAEVFQAQGFRWITSGEVIADI